MPQTEIENYCHKNRILYLYFSFRQENQQEKYAGFFIVAEKMTVLLAEI